MHGHLPQTYGQAGDTYLYLAFGMRSDSDKTELVSVMESLHGNAWLNGEKKNALNG